MCASLSEQATFLHLLLGSRYTERLCFTCSQNDHSNFPPPTIQCIITILLWSFWNWTWERKWDANNERCYLPTFTKQLNLAQPGNTILPVKLFRSIEKWGQEVEGWSTSDPVSPPWLQPSGGSAWVANSPTHDKVEALEEGGLGVQLTSEFKLNFR